MMENVTPELTDRLAALDLNGWVIRAAELVPNPDYGKDAPDEPKDLIARDRAFLAAFWRSDGAHWQHDIREWVMGNTTMIEHDRYDANGVLVDHSSVPPPPNMKGEGLDIAPSGPDYVFTGRFHEISSLPTRINLIAHMVRANVYHPYPGNMEPEGAYVPRELIGGSPAPPPEPTPGGSFTLDELMARLSTDRAFHDELQKYAKNGAREAIATEVQNENGALQFANAALFLRNQDLLLGVLKDGLYHWTMERVYQVLNENGLIHHTEPEK